MTQEEAFDYLWSGLNRDKKHSDLRNCAYGIWDKALDYAKRSYIKGSNLDEIDKGFENYYKGKPWNIHNVRMFEQDKWLAAINWYRDNLEFTSLPTFADDSSGQ